MMTKKHYQEIADVIKTEHRHQQEKFTPTEATTRIARRLCDVFAEDNPNFDKKRFLLACGLDND